MTVIKGIQAERLIANRYEELGYAVTIDPPRSAIPFSLGKYRPDILATKAEENLLIEVKGAGARPDPQVYLSLAQEVEQHRGWRFLLVTVPDAELQDSSPSISRDLSADAIRARLLQLDQLLENPETAELVLPYLWTAYIAALEGLASLDGIELGDCTDLSLVNKLYSGGITSIDEYERGRHFLRLRNRAVHSLETVATPTECKELRLMVERVLKRLNNPRD